MGDECVPASGSLRMRAFTLKGVFPMERRIGVMGVILEDRDKAAPAVNQLLSEHADLIVGRMGIPYRERNISVIALIVDGTNERLGALTGKLGNLPGVQVKVALTSYGVVKEK